MLDGVVPLDGVTESQLPPDVVEAAAVYANVPCELLTLIVSKDDVAPLA
jgi:hypothetical protein